MRKISGIYQITNKINGCIYIGSSCNMRDRIAEHKRRLKSGTHVNKHLQNAYNKYSKDNFIFKTLLYCDVKNLYYYEQLCIDKLHPRYNIAICVEAPTRGLVVSEETRRKLSEIHKGKPLSEETKRKLSEAMKGRAPWSKGKTNVFSDETRRKMSEIQRNISDETRRKMSASLLGNKNCLGKRNALGHTPWNKGKTGIYSEDHRHKISEANRNRSAETRKKIGDSNRRRVVTEETREKHRLASTGRVLSEETKRKIGDASRGMVHSAQSRKNMSEAQKGKKLSEETRRKMSEANKGRIPWNKGIHTSKLVSDKPNNVL